MPVLSVVIPLLAIVMSGTPIQFDPHVDYPTNLNSTGVDAVDLDEDGDLDLAVSNRNSNDVSVLFNTGAGVFGNPTNYQVGLNPQYVRSGDLDSANGPDLVTPDISGDTVSVLMNDGGGTFTLGQQVPVFRPKALALADVDDDGDLDVAVVHSDSSSSRPSQDPGVLSLLLNDGTGLLTIGSSMLVGVLPRSIEFAQLGGGPGLDAVVANMNSGDVTVIMEAGFDPAMVTVSTAPVARYVSTGDFDLDGDVDLAVVHKDTDLLQIIDNIGGGAFVPSSTYITSTKPHSIISIDLDLDLDLDLVVSHVSSPRVVRVFVNDGSGDFAESVDLESGVGAEVAAADLNGDGLPDLATANTSSVAGSVGVHLNATMVSPVDFGFVDLGGASGSFGSCSVPAVPASTGVVELIGFAALDDWTPGTVQAVLGGSSTRLQLKVRPDGRLEGAVRMVSQTFGRSVSTTAPVVADGERLWVRYVYDTATGVGTFHTSTDDVADHNVVSWTQLGLPVSTGVTGEVFGGITKLIVGQANRLSNSPLAGKLFGAAFVFDATEYAVDFTTIVELTSTSPDYSQWGPWTLTGLDWTYTEGASDSPVDFGFVDLGGASGSFGSCSVPAVPASTGVVELIGFAALDDWTPGTVQAVLGGSSTRLQLKVRPDGRLEGAVRMVSQTFGRSVSTTAPVVADGERLWVRYVYDTATGVGTFHTSTDDVADHNVVSWTQLGLPVSTGVTGEVFGGITKLIVGQANRLSNSPLAGKLFGAAFVFDATEYAVDFTTIVELTSTSPDYSQWGPWTLTGLDWTYTEGT